MIDVSPGEVSDAQNAGFALVEDYVLITKDDDSALRHALPGLLIVWLRLGNASNRRLAEWLDLRWAEICQALEAGESALEIR